MEASGGPAQSQWRLRSNVSARKTRASLPLDGIRRPCRSCRTPRYSPPVRMIKLTEQRELSPYVWVHPDEER
jgi:RNase P subunit RPR2